MIGRGAVVGDGDRVGVVIAATDTGLLVLWSDGETEQTDETGLHTERDMTACRGMRANGPCTDIAEPGQDRCPDCGGETAPDLPSGLE